MVDAVDISLNRYLHVIAESVGEGQDFGIESNLASVCSPRSIDQSHLSRLCLHAQSPDPLTMV